MKNSKISTGPNLFKARHAKAPKKKKMTTQHKALVEMYNRTPNIVINRAPKSLQKGFSDLPLFIPKNQVEIF
jgi:N-dimethylarginine dimethylaminohydrolase